MPGSAWALNSSRKSFFSFRLALFCSFFVPAVAGQPLPESCDGKNLLPYLKGKKKGDVHEHIFWHNADPTDAPRRNLHAVR